MHGIGNKTDAEIIYSWVLGLREERNWPDYAKDGAAPDGWKYIASGSFRSVWLSPEGVAYKVEHDERGGYSRQSANEIENLKIAWERGVPEGCRLPRFDDFRLKGEVVVAIEYITGDTLYRYSGPKDTGDLYGLMHKFEKELRLCDMHDENVIVDADGLLVPVDLGN